MDFILGKRVIFQSLYGSCACEKVSYCYLKLLTSHLEVVEIVLDIITEDIINQGFLAQLG